MVRVFSLFLCILLLTANQALAYDSAWTKRIPITIEASQVDADLTDFPVYLDLSDFDGTGLFANANSNGSDLRVVKSDGTTEVPIELVSYDAGATNGGELHFKASGTLSSTVNGTFYLYYGNSGASAYAASATYGAENVWDSNYVLVAHLQEDPNNDSAGAIIDSTSYGNDGTTSGTMTSADQVGGKLAGNSLDFDGSDDYLNFGTSPLYEQSATEITVTAWSYVQASDFNSTYFGLLSTTSSTSNPGFWVLIDDRAGSFQSTEGVTFANKTTVDQERVRVSNVISTLDWYYIDSRYSSNTGRVFVNRGGTNSTTVNSTGDFNPANADLFAGQLTGGTGRILGRIDEIRISKISRSDDWLDTEYNNQSSPSTFYTVGTQEANPGPVTTFTPRVISF